jgi:hypothetical protein
MGNLITSQPATSNKTLPKKPLSKKQKIIITFGAVFAFIIIIAVVLGILYGLKVILPIEEPVLESNTNLLTGPVGGNGGNGGNGSNSHSSYATSAATSSESSTVTDNTTLETGAATGSTDTSFSNNSNIIQAASVVFTGTLAEPSGPTGPTGPTGGTGGTGGTGALVTPATVTDSYENRVSDLNDLFLPDSFTTTTLSEMDGIIFAFNTSVSTPPINLDPAVVMFTDTNVRVNNLLLEFSKTNIKLYNNLYSSSGSLLVQQIITFNTGLLQLKNYIEVVFSNFGTQQIPSIDATSLSKVDKFCNVTITINRTLQLQSVTFCDRLQDLISYRVYAPRGTVNFQVQNMSVYLNDYLPPIMATFYPDCNYAGTQITLSDTFFNLKTETALGIASKAISSVKIPFNVRVFLWNEDSTVPFRSLYVLTAHNACLTLFNNMTTKIHLFRSVDNMFDYDTGFEELPDVDYNNEKVLMYRQPNYTGGVQEFGIGAYGVQYVMQSFKIPSTLCLAVYTGIFNDFCQIYTRDNVNFYNDIETNRINIQSFEILPIDTFDTVKRGKFFLK